MFNIKSGNITLSAMFIALGVILPMIFHAVGMGSTFLPLFWPVAACVFFLPIRYAITVGLMAPILSFLLTGMPPIAPPILHLIMAELFTLSVVSGLIYRYTKWGVFWVLLAGLTASRIALYIAAIPFASVLGIPPAIASIAFVLNGFLGIITMLALIPFLINRVKQEKIWGVRV